MNEMVLMIHIPAYASDCSHEILRQMKHILDVCGSSLEECHEMWQLDFDDVDKSAAVYTYDAQDCKHWKREWDAFHQKKWAQITATVYYAEADSQRKHHIGLGAVLIPHADFRRLPRENGERFMTIRISPYLWKFIDQGAFVQVVKEACIALRATYACIDEEAPVGGIYEGLFRLLTNESEGVDVEHRLPGVYWVQIVSNSHVEETGQLKEIAEHVPCERVEIIDNNGKDMLLMQMTEDSRKASRKKRLSMRAFFRDSLYRIEIKEAHIEYTNWGNWKYMGPSLQKAVLRRMKMIPFTDDEIAKLLKIET